MRFVLFSFIVILNILPQTIMAAYEDNDLLGVRFPQQKLDQESHKKWSTIFSGLMDMRMVQTGKSRNWQTPSSNLEGGPGLSRYGGVDQNDDGTGDKTSQELHLGQLSFVTDVLYEKEQIFHAQINVDDFTDDQDSYGQMGLAEAYLRKTLQNGDVDKFYMRMGVVFPPISMEHPGVAWSTKYTITPSAHNTWIGEEVKPLAFELNWIHELDTSVLKTNIAVFSSNDPVGAILSWRGWALHDYQAVWGTRLRFQKQARSPKQVEDPFTELDGELGVYGGMDWEFDKLKVKIFYFANNGHEQIKNGTTKDYSWDTQFVSAGFSYEFTQQFEWVSQMITGNTSMGGGDKLIKNNYMTWYSLLSYVFLEKYRMSIRYDHFQVDDKDDYLADLNDQMGNSFALAFLKSIDSVQTFGIEYLSITAERNGNSGYGTQDADDDLLQFMYRISY